MVEVEVRDGDNLDVVLKKFRRKMIRSGLFKDMKKRRFYEKPSAARKRKKAEARRRNGRRRTAARRTK
jgi:small subunit ribosomal protein S21